MSGQLILPYFSLGSSASESAQLQLGFVHPFSSSPFHNFVRVSGIHT